MEAVYCNHRCYQKIATKVSEIQTDTGHCYILAG